MRPAQARIARRAALSTLITATCNRRHDSEAHRKACIDETLREPEEDWYWWEEYWRRADPSTWDLEAVKAGAAP